MLAGLDANKATATRNNRDPEATLLRAGFIYRGHCGNRLNVTRHRERGANYRCDWTAADRHNCPRPTILARVIDPIVWDAAANVLRNPATIVREVERRRNDGSLARDLAAMERMLAHIADKQGRIAKRVAAIDDDDVAELRALAANTKAMERERDDPRRRIADEEADAARLRGLSQWCQTVPANLDALTYDERRLALSGLGVTVRIWRPGATDDRGNPRPRWQIDLAPASAPSPAPIVSGAACAAATPPPEARILGPGKPRTRHLHRRPLRRRPRRHPPRHARHGRRVRRGVAAACAQARQRRRRSWRC